VADGANETCIVTESHPLAPSATTDYLWSRSASRSTRWRISGRKGVLPPGQPSAVSSTARNKRFVGEIKFPRIEWAPVLLGPGRYNSPSHRLLAKRVAAIHNHERDKPRLVGNVSGLKPRGFLSTVQESAVPQSYEAGQPPK